MKTKRLFSVLFTLTMLIGLFQAFGITANAEDAVDITVTIDTGDSVTLKDNDKDGYYEIGTTDELYAFATIINNLRRSTINAELTSNIVVNTDVKKSGKTSELRIWEPIGTTNNSSYNGIFDGKNYAISGIYVNAPNKLAVGLFGYLGSNAEIKNLFLSDSFIYGKKFTGGLAGCNEGSITNCHNTGCIKCVDYYIGGIAGQNQGIIANCSNSGEIVGESNFVGGITGYNSGIVTTCYNTGNISGNIDPWNSSLYIGGVVGYNNDTVTNCSNLASSSSAGIGGGSGDVTSKTEANFEFFAHGARDNRWIATVVIPTAGKYTLIFVDYEETKLNIVDTVTVTAENNNTIIPITSNINMTLGTGDKIMLWQDMTNLAPLCCALIIE